MQAPGKSTEIEHSGHQMALLLCRKEDVALHSSHRPLSCASKFSMKRICCERHLLFSTCCCLISRVRLFMTLQTVVARLLCPWDSLLQWSGLPFPPPEDLSNPSIKTKFPCFLHWQTGSLPLSHLGSQDYRRPLSKPPHL